MNRILFLLGLALCATPALAADHEVSLEMGSLHANDTSWDMFSDTPSFNTYGLRVGYAFHDRIAAIAGYHHGANGMTVEAMDSGWESGDPPTFASAFYGDEYSLGIKADLPLSINLRPFATVQALGVRGLIRLDDDAEHDDNLNQIQQGAFAPGGMATGGIDLRIPIAQAKYCVASSLEFGYGKVLDLDFGDLGKLPMGGFVFRWGVGVRM